jgi:hypothetical protein
MMSFPYDWKYIGIGDTKRKQTEFEKTYLKNEQYIIYTLMHLVGRFVSVSVSVSVSKSPSMPRNSNLSNLMKHLTYQAHILKVLLDLGRAVRPE